MRLATGQPLGPYQILAPIGAGGMGEVYRARDSRLGREVAIKVLPADRLADEGRRQRFLREARAASSLNHPHIVTIHEIEAVDGVDFIVMELVRGQTLEARLRGPRMGIADVIRVATPIADALAAAHARGIVHRDIKPANVVVTPEGVVKVLDFGLAKLVLDEEDCEYATGTTLSGAFGLSHPGAVTGTAGYMSPEQATGQEVDTRSDIFSFGALLYEMVTGRRAFPGRTASETLAAVLRDEPPPPRVLAPEVPELLERLILRCLRKEPDKRIQHSLDVKLELEEIGYRDRPATARAAPRLARPAFVVVAGLTLGLALAALAAWLLWIRPVPPAPSRVVPLTALPGVEAFPSFSPDGKQVAFGWSGEKTDNLDVYVKIVGGSEIYRVTTSPERDTAPSWSPDGRLIAFVRMDSSMPPSYSLHLVSPLGGAEPRVGDWPATIAPVAWTPDSRFLAAPRAVPAGDATPGAFGLFLIPVDGGEPRPLTQPRANGQDVAPAFSPDGRRLAYATCARPVGSPCDVWTVDLGPGFRPSSPPRRLTPRPVYKIERIAWTADGRSLVFDTELGPETFYLQRVAADASGSPERLEMAGVGARFPAIAGDRLAFTRWLFDQDIVRFAPGQPPDVFAGSSYLDGLARYSRDGRHVAFESMRSGERLEIWLADAEGKSSRQLTHGPGQSQGSPAWSPDGRRIAFDSQGEDGHWHVFTIEVDGSSLRQITGGSQDENVPSWSSDGRFIYFGARGGGREGAWRVSPEDGHQEQVAPLGAGSIVVAQESADGRTLLVATNVPPFPLVAHPLDGGPDTILATGVLPGRSFATAGSGVYYATIGKGFDAVLHRRDLTSGREAVLGPLERFRGGLSVSPDEKVILFTSATKIGADLMLVEGFR